MTAECWEVTAEMDIRDTGDRNRDARGRILDYANPGAPEDARYARREAFAILSDLRAGRVSAEDALTLADFVEALLPARDVGHDAIRMLRHEAPALSKLRPALAKVSRAKHGAMFRTGRGFVVVSRATRADAQAGSWQITYFDSDMRPTGHRFETSIEAATRDVFSSECDPELVRWNPGRQATHA